MHKNDDCIYLSDIGLFRDNDFVQLQGDGSDGSKDCNKFTSMVFIPFD